MLFPDVPGAVIPVNIRVAPATLTAGRIERRMAERIRGSILRPHDIEASRSADAPARSWLNDTPQRCARSWRELDRHAPVRGPAVGHRVPGIGERIDGIAPVGVRIESARVG
jgi:hypothetical protein